MCLYVCACALISAALLMMCRCVHQGKSGGHLQAVAAGDCGQCNATAAMAMQQQPADRNKPTEEGTQKNRGMNDERQQKRGGYIGTVRKKARREMEEEKREGTRKRELEREGERRVGELRGGEREREYERETGERGETDSETHSVNNSRVLTIYGEGSV